MAAVQLVLARGVRLDWFESTEIVLECLAAALAFYVFIVHCLTTRAPFLNLRLLRDRNYAIGLVLVTIYGMLNFTPMVLLPPLLQQYAGFPDALVGQVIGCRGVGMTVGFLMAGLTSRLDPRIGMSMGFLIQVASGVWMLTFDLNVTMEILVLNSLVQGFSVGMIWVPLSVVAFDTLAPTRPRRSGLRISPAAQYRLELLHFALDRRDRPRNGRELQPHDRDDLALQHDAFAALGDGRVGSGEQRAGLAKIAKEINRQAAMIGYLNAFLMYSVASGLGLLFVLTVRRKKGSVLHT